MNTEPLTPEERKEFNGFVRAAVGTVVLFGGAGLGLYKSLPDDWEGAWLALGIAQVLLLVVCAALVVRSIYCIIAALWSPRAWIYPMEEETEE
jgi:hypothetical protein